MRERDIYKEVLRERKREIEGKRESRRRWERERVRKID